MVQILPKIIIFLLCYFLFLPSALGQQKILFQSKISAIPVAIQKTMKRYTWSEGCPVPLSDLSYLQLSYWGFDNKPHQGILIVNKQIAFETVQIFHQLFMIKFPIEKMQPLDFYQGNDMKSMADNNTVAFNCRVLTSDPRFFSKHSYGTAIDINPLINPYIRNGVILPPQAIQYDPNNSDVKGRITRNSSTYKIFMKYGWQWGGNWQDIKDYQHFEKNT